MNVDQLVGNIDIAEFIHLKKGEIAFKKNSEHSNCVYVLLNTALKGATIEHSANSILHKEELKEKKAFKVKEDMVAVEEGELCKIKYETEVAPSPISISVKKEEIKDGKEDKSLLEKKMQINDFHVVRKLREGNFGKVYACYNTKTLKLYAIKVLDRQYV